MPAAETHLESARRHVAHGELLLAEGQYLIVESDRASGEDLVLLARASRLSLRLEGTRTLEGRHRAQLGEILLRSTDPTTVSVAAHALSLFLRPISPQRAVEFAGRSYSAAPPRLRGDAAHNLACRLLAAGSPRQAMGLLKEAVCAADRPESHRALSRSLVAYGQALLGERRSARSSLVAALEGDASVEDSPYAAAYQLNLGFALAEAELFDQALHHAEAALGAAARFAALDLAHERRCALLLKGDALLRLGRPLLAREAFGAFVEAFRPGRVEIVDLLLRGNSSHFLNWLA